MSYTPEHSPANRPRILVVGQAVHPTGYARVLQTLFTHLASRYDIHQFALNYRGPLQTGHVTIHPNCLPGDTHGSAQLAPLVAMLKPQVVWLLHDLYLYPLLAPRLVPFRGNLDVVLYCPIDGTQPNPDKLRTAATVDHLVLFTNFARHEVKQSFDYLMRTEPDFHSPPISVIPHGIDLDRFAPLPGGRPAARAALFPERPELANAFVVLNANRNCGRKRIDITLRAFAEFARHKPHDVYLYLHMGMLDRGVDVLRLASELGISHRVLCTSTDIERPHVPDEYLNLVYNACDVGVNTATGEGWGLVAFEHGATGAAQVMPAHSACRDLWDGAAVLIEPEEEVHNPFDFVTHQSVTPSAVATALERLYLEPSWLATMSARARQRTLDPALCWNSIANLWDTLLRRLLKRFQ